MKPDITCFNHFLNSYFGDCLQLNRKLILIIIGPVKTAVIRINADFVHQDYLLIFSIDINTKQIKKFT